MKQNGSYSQNPRVSKETKWRIAQTYECQIKQNGEYS